MKRNWRTDSPHTFAARVCMAAAVSLGGIGEYATGVNGAPGYEEACAVLRATPQQWTLRQDSAANNSESPDSLEQQLKEALKKEGSAFLGVLTKLETADGEFPVDVLPAVNRRLAAMHPGETWEEDEANVRALSAYLASVATPHAEGESRAASNRLVGAIARRTVEDLESKKVDLLFVNIVKLDSLLVSIGHTDAGSLDELPSTLLERFTGKSSWVAVSGSWHKFMADHPNSPLTRAGHETLRLIGDSLVKWAKNKSFKTTVRVLDELFEQANDYPEVSSSASEAYAAPYDALGDTLDREIGKVVASAEKARSSRNKKGRKADYSRAAETYAKLAKTLEQSSALRQTYIDLLPRVADAMYASAIEDNKTWREKNVEIVFHTNDFNLAGEWADEWVSEMKAGADNDADYIESLSLAVDIHLDMAWHYAELCGRIRQFNPQSRKYAPEKERKAGIEEVDLARGFASQLAKLADGKALSAEGRKRAQGLENSLRNLQRPQERTGGSGR